MFCLGCNGNLTQEDTICYGMHSRCFEYYFQVPSTQKFTNLARRSASSNEEISALLQDNSFYQGKFKKYSAKLGDRSFILKMRQPDAPELPEVESLCNQIGAYLGIPVAKFCLIDFEGDVVFVTENFVSGNQMMDLKHIYHFRTSEQHNCKDLINLIRVKTQRPYYVKIFVHMLLFDALIGNHDRHGRNLGFLVTPSNITLSPIYDNVSVLSLETGGMLKADFNPLGKIATSHTNEPSMYDYVIELCKLGFKEEVSNFISKLIFPELREIGFLIANSHCSEPMKYAMDRLINKRYQELLNGWEDSNRS